MPFPVQYSDYLSTLALVISCASFFLSWRQFVRDASRLKLYLNYERETGSGSFKLTIINDGRRPVTIEKIYLVATDNKRYSVLAGNFELEESQPYDVSIVLSAYGLHPVEVSRIIVWDTNGRKKSISTRNLQKKIRESY